jgi:predicted SnoaL-like aldol condensation-catalyzing enzyme
MDQKIKNTQALYLEGIRDGNAEEAVKRYTGERYTQHSTGVADGVDGFLEFFKPFIENNPGRNIELVRVLGDAKENKVFIQAYQEITNKEGEVAKWVTTDFFDFDENDKIIEHWDVIAPFHDSTPSGHTSTDGQTDIEDEDKTEDNKAVVRGLLENIMMAGGDKSKFDEYVSSDEYTQHNPEVTDGIESFRPLAMMKNPPLVYTDIVHLIGQGNFVATLCKATWEGKPYAQVDLFRLKNGKIVEHWDNVEPVPEGPQPNSGKF